MGGSAHVLVAASSGGSRGKGFFPTPGYHARPSSGGGKVKGGAWHWGTPQQQQKPFQPLYNV